MSGDTFAQAAPVFDHKANWPLLVMRKFEHLLTTASVSPNRKGSAVSQGLPLSKHHEADLPSPVHHPIAAARSCEGT